MTVKERLKVYKEMLKYMKENDHINVGFCWLIDKMGYTREIPTDQLFPELWARRTRQGLGNRGSFSWYNGRNERINALKSAIWELRKKVWTSNVLCFFRLRRRTESM